MRSKLVLSGLALLSFVNLPMAAADPQVALSHSRTMEGVASDGRTIDLELRVENRGDEPVHGLMLSLVPQHRITPEGSPFYIGTLGPREYRALTLRLVVPVASTGDQPKPTELYWGVVYLDDEGKRVEFLGASREDGKL